ncbi:MAG: sugar O-acetyltransferase [Treponema sp.]|nr:sugar O-acetyltransferase [Treponema sp.]
MDNITRRDSGLPYISDEAVIKEQAEARRIVQELNTADSSDFKLLSGIIKKLIPESKEGIFINPPFHCDYGFHIKTGKNLFINYNCVILDVAQVTIGDNVQIAPNVAIYTAGHPVHPVSRNSGYEYGIPVVIGNNVWIGGNVVICPGVTIGDNAVIGAGSVVTKDIPADSVAAGNPCRIIRSITEEDKIYYYKKNKFDEESWGIIEKKDGGNSNEHVL